MARTDTLPHFLTDVADAIREKKGTSETILASDFDTEIANLPSGGGADLSEYFYTEITEDTSYQSRIGNDYIKKIPEINVNNSVNSLSYAFYGASFLNKEIKINFNNNIQYLNSLFEQAADLINVDFSNCDFSNVVSVSSMFKGRTSGTFDTKLKNIDLSNFNGNNLTSASDMFVSRRGLENINLSNLYTPLLTNTERMFYDCRGLIFLDIRKMVFDGVTKYTNMFYSTMPNDCLIIVKSDTEKEWITSKFTFLTNVKTVAEYEAEQSE